MSTRVATGLAALILGLLALDAATDTGATLFLARAFHDLVTGLAFWR